MAEIANKFYLEAGIGLGESTIAVGTSGVVDWTECAIPPAQATQVPPTPLAQPDQRVEASEQPASRKGVQAGRDHVRVIYHTLRNTTGTLPSRESPDSM